jgi:hypothetical protein
MVQTAEIERLNMKSLAKNKTHQFQSPSSPRNHHRSARARSWSLDSYSTISTADETRDISAQDRSVCSSVVWEGDTPIEINVPFFSRNILRPSQHSRQHTSSHFFGDCLCEESMQRTRGRKSHISQSTPIDLDIMDDYYNYEWNHGKSVSNQTSAPQPIKSYDDDDDDDDDDEKISRPLTHLTRKAPGRNSSGGLECLAHLPERFTRFEI